MIPAKRTLRIVALLLSHLADLLARRKESAGREDVLASRRTDRREDAVVGQVVAEGLHPLLVRLVKGHVGDLVEAYQIHATLQSFQQTDDGAGVGRGVVESTKQDVLEGESALVGEVVLAQQFHYLLDAHASFGWHELRTLLGDGGVEADGHVAVALVEEAAQLLAHADAADRDALRRPGPTVVGGEDLRGTEHVVEVVHWLALSHEDDVGELVHIGKGIDLVEDVGCRETALKTLFARLTEQAVHLAAHLRRHTQRGAVAVGDIDRLDKLMAELLFGSARIDGEQVFDRPVLGVLGVDGRMAAHCEALGKQLAMLL